MSKWGYRKGEAQIFDLKDGEKLPDGWSDICPTEFHPNVPKASAVIVTREVTIPEPERPPVFEVGDIKAWADGVVHYEDPEFQEICKPDQSRPRMSRKRK